MKSLKTQSNIIHVGSITFNTKETLERPYMDDLERKIARCITKYLNDNDFKFSKKKFRIDLYSVSKDYQTPPVVALVAGEEE